MSAKNYFEETGLLEPCLKTINISSVYKVLKGKSNYMKNGKTKKTKPGIRNAGSGAFNQRSKQDNGAKKVIPITDHEKLTGHRRISSANKNR